LLVFTSTILENAGEKRLMVSPRVMALNRWVWKGAIQALEHHFCLTTRAKKW